MVMGRGRIRKVFFVFQGVSRVKTAYMSEPPLTEMFMIRACVPNLGISDNTYRRPAKWRSTKTNER